ncbi:MAG: hypothetical protein BWK77_00765 [Verrucomicrobia bacterium A1]|nr:MAG: hypothetical protein BWK77_00765 [Verrucomicrobia bacterium A1]
MEAPAPWPLGLLLSIGLHALLIVVLARPAAAPPVEVAETYDVFLQSPVAVVPPAVAGMGDDGTEEPMPYWAAVRRRIARRLPFPADVMAALGAPVTILVRIEIAPDGRLVRAEVLTPGADPALVELVLDAIRRSAPFPVPRARDREGLVLTAELPIRFVAL